MASLRSNSKRHVSTPPPPLPTEVSMVFFWKTRYLWLFRFVQSLFLFYNAYRMRTQCIVTLNIFNNCGAFQFISLRRNTSQSQQLLKISCKKNVFFLFIITMCRYLVYVPVYLATPLNVMSSIIVGSERPFALTANKTIRYELPGSRLSI